MGSSDYLNSAKRAAIVFFLLAAGALGAAGYGLAVSAWGSGPVAFGTDANPRSEPHRRTGRIYWQRPANSRIAEGSADAGAGL